MRIAIVTADDGLTQLIETEVRKLRHEPERFTDLGSAVRRSPDLIFAEWVSGPGLAALMVDLRAAANREPPIPVVALVSEGSAGTVRRACSAGAADALLSPPDSDEIYAEIQQLCGPLRIADPEELKRFQNITSSSLIGVSPVFEHVLGEMWLAAHNKANVLLIGETGTGKEMFAQAIHSLGENRGAPYVAVHCAGIPAELLESELFGAAKGAYTGSQHDRAGRFEVAGAGTLLLDEVGDIELKLQVKLLRVLEQRVFQRLGETHDRPFKARLISATSVDLDEALKQGKLRTDFLGRINQFKIQIPPLRERRADIPILVDHFLKKHAGVRKVVLNRVALEILQTYDFPMNVRQLENAVVEGLARSDPGNIILQRHLPKDIVSPTAAYSPQARHTFTLASDLSYQDALTAAEVEIDRIYLNTAMKKNRGNRTRTADELGIDRKTLAARLARLAAEEDSHGHG